MEQRTMTNAKVVQIMQRMTDEAGAELRKKRLPLPLVYAMRRSLPEMQEAYAAYAATLNEICQRYDTTPETVMQADKACLEEIGQLLSMEVSVAVHSVPQALLEGLDVERYDALSFEDVDRLWWLVEGAK